MRHDPVTTIPDLAASKRSKTPHYPALDGLRGVAALAVVAYHTSIYFQFAYVPAHAYLAVDFFFMLSGYVIAYAYDHRLAQNMSVSRFILVRFIRLYPLAVLGVIEGSLALIAHARMDPQLHVHAIVAAAMANAFLLPTRALLEIRAYAFPTDPPLWSLAFEVWINILYALLFRALTKRVLTVTLVIGAMLVLWASVANGGLNIGLFVSDLYDGAIRVLFPFVAGVLVQRSLMAGNRVYKTQLAHASFVPLILVLLGPDAVSGIYSGIYDAAAVLIAFPAILYLGTLAPPALRMERVWSVLGALSYPLYVLHFPMVAVVSNLVHQRHWHGGLVYAAAIATYAAAVALSVLAYQLYDLPFRRILTKRFVMPGSRAHI